nr:Hsp20/alpha crystallin family protein [Petropleomorpha daqingensis]
MRENRPHGSVWAQATRADRTAPREDAADGPSASEAILVDEYRDGGVHVVRAALPGIDPDQDVELTAEDGALRITVKERAQDGRDYVRRELRRSASTRTLPLPERAKPSDISATYRDGVLEIRIPLAEPPAAETTRITVTRE